MMKRAKRTFTQDEKDLVSRLWKQGIGFSDIGRILNAALARYSQLYVKLVVLNQILGKGISNI